MQTRQVFFPITVTFAAMAVSFAAGVYSAPWPHKMSNGYMIADASGSASVLEEPFDYFPSHYVNQATEVEELPAQFCAQQIRTSD